MAISALLVAAGFACLILGANLLVDGASSLAKKHRVSDLAIGLTIVAFGTSAPELVVNVAASLQGRSDIVLGNIIGSNNFNLFIILGLAGLLAPIAVQSSTAWKEIPISLAATLLLLLLANDFFMAEPAHLGRTDGLFMLALFSLFLYYVFTQMNAEQGTSSEPAFKSNTAIWGSILVGLLGLLAGGQLVVDNSVAIASQLGVSEKIIGLTIVAAGTSLPELVTSTAAALKRNSDMAIGNVIGSNVFNILLILPISCLVNPIGYNPKFNAELYLLIGGTLFLLLAMITGQRKKLDRWEAALLFTFYIGYTLFLLAREMQ